MIDAPLHPHLSQKAARSRLRGEGWGKGGVPLLPAAGCHPALLFRRVVALVSLWAPVGVRCFHRKLQRVLLGLSVKASWIGVCGGVRSAWLRTPPPTQTNTHTHTHSGAAKRRCWIAPFFCHCNEAKLRPEASLSLKGFYPPPPPPHRACLPLLLSWLLYPPPLSTKEVLPLDIVLRRRLGGQLAAITGGRESILPVRHSRRNRKVTPEAFVVWLGAESVPAWKRATQNPPVMALHRERGGGHVLIPD